MKKIFTILDKLEIKYKLHKHPAIFNLEQAEKYYKDINGGQCKNLFIRNKNGKNHYLVILPNQKNLDLKKLRIILEETRLGFASCERLEKYLNLTPGSVSPFGLINDLNKEVVVIIDNELLDCRDLHFHPNINTASIELSTIDFKKFLNWTENKIIFVDL